MPLQRLQTRCPQMSAEVPMSSVRYWQRIVEQLGSVCPPRPAELPKHWRKCLAKVIKHAQAHRHMTASSSVLHSWDDKGNPIPFTLNMLNINSLQIDDDGTIRDVS
jgi:hypothetical protein